MEQCMSMESMIYFLDLIESHREIIGAWQVVIIHAVEETAIWIRQGEMFCLGGTQL